jgi:hypothetical protein
MSSNKRERIQDAWPDQEFLFADGLDAAILGVCDQTQRIIYSKRKVLRILERQGLSWEDAREHFDFNIAAAFVGEQTPIWLDDEF